MKLLVLLLVWFTPFLYGEGSLLWESDFEKALTRSQQEGRAVVLFFSASDSSGPSMKMKKEILDNREFRESLEGHFLFFQIDFPVHHALSEEVVLQNRKLQEQFRIEHLPSLIVLDSEQQELARLEYSLESKEDLSQQLLQMVAMDKKLKAAQALLQNKVPISGTRLSELYEMAVIMGQPERAALILKAGLNSESYLFFTLQSYQNLLREGRGSSEEARQLRLTLTKAKDEGTFYSLVVMEFQELSKSGDKKDLAQLVAPLKEYLSEYGSSKSENVWRTEMMIAQVYVSFDQYQLAYDYAKKAYEKAPAGMKDEIANSLRYIAEQNESIAVK